MTANRVVTGHSELQNSGQVSHPQLDAYVNTSPFLIVSGVAGSVTPNARKLKAGNFVTLLDVGGELTISATISGSSGISETTHKSLRQLVHLADGGGPFEGFSSGAVRVQGPVPFPTASIWYTDGSRTLKIVEELITYNSNMTVASEQWRAYDVDGTTVVATVTDAITYQDIYEISRIRTIA